VSDLPRHWRLSKQSCQLWLFGWHLRRLHTGLGGLAGLGAEAGLTGCAPRRARSTGSALYCCGCALQRRLVGGGEESAAIRTWIVNELPLIVVIFLIKYADGFIFASAGYSNHGSAAEDLIAAGRASRGSSASTGSARPRLPGICSLVRSSSSSLAVRIFPGVLRSGPVFDGYACS
jgi:hypothetical protein